jgi:surfactin family lipopeptide synthetase A
LKDDYLTLPDLLKDAAHDHPGNGVGFIRPDGGVHFHPYPSMLDEALSLLAGMQSAGIGNGDRIILASGKNEEIVPALWACFLGGVVPALLQPPLSFTEYNPAAEKISRVFRRLDKPFVIISQDHLPYWEKTGISENHLLPFHSLLHPAKNAKPVKSKPGDLAFIQFSSGSTGEPKGIMLTHSNILHNVKAIIHGIQLNVADIGVNWMPLYHDMGMIGFVLTPTKTKMTQYLIDTQDFIKNPLLWLDVLDKYRGTITACPNFGQELMKRALHRNPERKWDLSTVRILFNGAEPISARIMQHFLGRLEPFGFRPEAMLPAYGMAEATLAVTFTVHDRNPRVLSFHREDLLKKGIAAIVPDKSAQPYHLVNLGKPIKFCDIRITGEEGKSLSEDIIGHIQVRGPNLTGGYYNDQENTLSLFEGEWLNTGDLGFIHDGDLFVTGRRKDIIFINGINYYAADLEEFASSIDDIQTGKIVISGYFDQARGMDRILVFMVGTYNETTHQQYLRLKHDFQHRLGLKLDTFVPLRSAEVPRTSSGKLQRFRLVERFIQGDFPKAVYL